jgi:hypothetical protein
MDAEDMRIIMLLEAEKKIIPSYKISCVWTLSS